MKPFLIALGLIVWQSSLEIAGGDWIVSALGEEGHVDIVLFQERFVWLAIGLALAAWLFWINLATQIFIPTLAIFCAVAAILDRSVYAWAEMAVQVSVLAGLLDQMCLARDLDRKVIQGCVAAHTAGCGVAILYQFIWPSVGVYMAAPDWLTQSLMFALMVYVVLVYAIPLARHRDR